MVNMTLKYRMIVDKHSKPDGVVGGSTPNCETFSLLDGKLHQI